ncbi:hypothetical protein PY257_16360 [Ramlibacter sp. H39-3-26]|uniref:hypothetical protein n=1 Tax=Curvibacter soli TaxID=3031331 RepID=UPI0023DCBFDB|nr:hypothetical protein [Ramlibacter sp. H39-3-26]MDF1486723.1 hypothetical protein [Ramlibacter sp. H39-3-26]
MSAPTKRQLSGAQRRSLRAMREKLLNMAAEWDGVDQFCMSALEDLACACEQAAMDLMIEKDESQ